VSKQFIPENLYFPNFILNKNKNRYIFRKSEQRDFIFNQNFKVSFTTKKTFPQKREAEFISAKKEVKHQRKKKIIICNFFV